MKRWLLAISLLFLAPLSRGQNPTLQGWCEAGAQPVVTSGLTSSTQVQQSFPACTVTVFVHGAGLATIFSDASNTPLSNPFTAQSNGRWIFYVASGRYDVQLSGAGFPSPVTYLDLTTSGGSGGTPGGSPIQTQVNNNGVFGGTPCEFVSNLSTGPLNTGCDWHSIGPNPYVDITRFGARAFTTPAQQTTATCNGTTSVTLTAAIDYINGDGIVLHQCGPASSLSTPSAPSSVTPKGILNGVTTRCYEIVAEDNSLGRTAASGSTCTNTAASSFGTTPVTLTTCTLQSGTVTCNTSANHNFEVGETVKVSGTTVINGVFKVKTTPSNTSFTFDTFFKSALPWAFNTGSGGTAECPAHNWVKWTGQNSVMRYLVYRQDGGAGAFALVGIAQGLEPFFDDYNFTAPTITNMPEVPSTAPVSAANQALATTIVSGAGTTSIVVQNPATNNISGVAALHDNTQPVLAAAASALSNRGGSVFVPNGGTTASTFFIMNFPLALPSPASNGTLTYYISGNIFSYQPIILASFSTFVGNAIRDVGAPAFSTTYYGPLIGSSYPLFISQGKTNVFFSHIFFSDNMPQAWTGLIDAVPTIGSGASTSVNFEHCYLRATASGGLPLVLRGVGFDHLFYDTVFDTEGASASNYFYYAGLRLMGSSVTTPTGWPGLGHMRNSTFLGAGFEADADALPGGVLSNGGSPWTFENVYTENTCAPTFQFRNVSSGNWSNYAIDNLTVADTVCGSTPVIDMTVNVSGLQGLRLSRMNSGGTAGAQINIGAGAQGVSFNGESVNDVFNVSPNGYVSIAPTSYNSGSGGTTNKTVETNSVVRVVPPGRAFVQGASPSNVSATVVAGGTIPINTWFYVVTALDINGGESAPGTGASPVVTSSGNQTVNVTWTAPSPAPAGYNVYRSGSSGFGYAHVNNSVVTTTSFTDTGAFFSGAGVSSSGGGPTGISSAGIWSNIHTWSSGLFRSDVTAPSLTANRAVTWPDAAGNALISTSATPSLKFLDCQTTSTCAQASVSSPVFLIKGGPIALSGGTITIGSLPYASSASYVCDVNDVTATNAVQVVYTSGSSVTFNGTTTDSIRYICWGI